MVLRKIPIGLFGVREIHVKLDGTLRYITSIGIPLEEKELQTILCERDCTKMEMKVRKCDCCKVMEQIRIIANGRMWAREIIIMSFPNFLQQIQEEFCNLLRTA